MEIYSCLWLSAMIHNHASRNEAGTPSHQLGFQNIAKVFPVLAWISLLSSGDPTPPSVASSLLFPSICIKHQHGPDTWSSAGKTHRALVSLEPTLGWKRKSQELASHGNESKEQPLQACCLHQLSTRVRLRGGI